MALALESKTYALAICRNTSACPETLPLSVKHFLQLAKGYQANDLDQVANRLNIYRLLDNPMQKLSGGELQRVLLGRALLSKPELLVLDEPVQGLDVSGQSELYHLISDLKDELNCGVLMVSHDLHLVMAATDKVVCLNGHICCEGHPQTIQQRPKLLRIVWSVCTCSLSSVHSSP